MWGLGIQAHLGRWLYKVTKSPQRRFEPAFFSRSFGRFVMSLSCCIFVGPFLILSLIFVSRHVIVIHHSLIIPISV